MLQLATFTIAMHKPAATDLDVAALPPVFLATVRCSGGRVRTGAGVRAADQYRGRSPFDTYAEEHQAAVAVNAVCARADEFAVAAGVKPVGLFAGRPSAGLVALPAGLVPRDWPLAYEVAESCYFLAESDGLPLSSAGEASAPAGDACPDYLDVALAAERVGRAITLVIRSVRQAWARLRTFAPDDTPVLGVAGRPGVHGLAGLGGSGIQTALEVGRLLAAQETESSLPAALAAGRFQ